MEHPYEPAMSGFLPVLSRFPVQNSAADRCLVLRGWYHCYSRISAGPWVPVGLISAPKNSRNARKLVTASLSEQSQSRRAPPLRLAAAHAASAPASARCRPPRRTVHMRLV